MFVECDYIIDSVRPPIKWAGGKSRLIRQFMPLFPRNCNFLVEPFVGGGAVFFNLRPTKAILIDTNQELINFYKVVKDNLELLLVESRCHKNDEEYYYRIRALDVSTLNNIQRASRFLYLNKTAYNGLWRENRKGQHNAPFGWYQNPRIVDEQNLRKVNTLLQRAELNQEDFSFVLNVAKPDRFIYMDPPYHPLSITSNFTSYTANSFNEGDQRRLADVFSELDHLGCRVMLSNSDTPLILELYKRYNICKVTARRAINCQAEGRGLINELVIRNYE